jgi:glutathione S-transferase
MMGKEMADLTLYGSLDVSRTWWTAWMCRELGVQFHNEPQGYQDPVWKAPEYLAINPNGLVPSIKDGQFVLWESMAINLYLAKKYGRGRLCPHTLEGEALASQWILGGDTAGNAAPSCVRSESTSARRQ